MCVYACKEGFIFIVKNFIIKYDKRRITVQEVFLTIRVGRCRIKELLDARGLTQQELAAKTGMSKSFISDKVRNRDAHGMRIDSAKRIAIALGCTIDDLYEWIPDQEEGKSDR